MSSKKRRIRRKVDNLVSILKTAALMHRQWSRRDTVVQRQHQMFANAQALGKHLSRRGFEKHARAAIQGNVLASSIVRMDS